jgi:hypothetical protein
MQKCATFDPSCPGWEPAILDAKTGRELERDHPFAQVVRRCWSARDRDAQERIWRVWVYSSTDHADRAELEAFNASVATQAAILDL